MRPRTALLTIRDTAAELGVSTAHVYRLMKDKKLAYVELGRRRRVTRAQLDDCIARLSVNVSGY